MREIKFRALDYNNEWVYGYFCKDYSGTAYITSLDGVTTSTVVPGTVSQFTGLKNKEAVEIYEGDIIKYLNQFCVVIFGKKTLGFGFNFDYKTNWNLVNKFYRLNSKNEIVGNIYQNQELLNS